MARSGNIGFIIGMGRAGRKRAYSFWQLAIGDAKISTQLTGAG
jgi:hypothetical protein